MNRREFLNVAAVVAAGLSSSARAVKIGDRVTWSDVMLLDGRTLSASALAGRVVVVELWASWCPFCALQNPRLQQLYDEHHGRGLEFLTFSIDRDPAKAREYIARHGYTFPAAMATRASEAWFGPREGLPELYVVDRDGRIVVKEVKEMIPEDLHALASFAQN